MWTLPFTFAAVFAGLFCGTKKRLRRMVLSGLAVFLVSGMIACGGGGSTANSQQSTPRSPTTATLTVTGTAGGQSATTSLTLTITH